MKGHLLPVKRSSFTKHCISRCYVRYANHKEKNFIKNKKTGLTAGICNLKYFLRCIRNPASVVRSLVYEPYYLFVRISYNKLTALIKQIKLAICQIITYQLGAIHPERNESVTGRGPAHNKRKSDLRQICKKQFLSRTISTSDPLSIISTRNLEDSSYT